MAEFKGFDKATIQFYENLKNNNNKEWFEKNRSVYDEKVLAPSRKFVESFGKMLRPGFIAEPKINKSLFKIFRDTRFSKNKSPFKLNLGLFFWEGSGRRNDCSGFYIHLQDGAVTFYTGVYEFTKEQLKKWRDTVVIGEHEAELDEIIKEVSGKSYETGAKHYKRIPRGYQEYKTNDYLLYNALWARQSMPVPDEFFSEDFLDTAYRKHIEMLPVHDFLVELVTG